MLPKKRRITKAVFEALMKEKRVASTNLFLFYSRKSDICQFAFVAPKNIFKKATTRNKYRRLGYNILRSIPSIKNKIGIFVYKKQAILATKEEIKKDIFYLLNK